MTASATSFGSPPATISPTGRIVEDRVGLCPPLTTAVPTRTLGRAGALAALAGLAAGALAASVGASASEIGLVVALGATLLTAVAANWSTCGLSVVSVIAAPKGSGRAGRSTPLARLCWHALGSVPVAAVTGAALAWVGGRLADGVAATAAATLVGALAALYGLHELGVITMPTPMRRRQLPRHWRRSMTPRRVAFLFGAIIGPGFLIFIRSSAYYVMALATALIGSPALGAAMFVVVALGRCAPGLTAIIYQQRGGAMPGFLELSLRVDRRVQLATGAALIGLGTFALAGILVP